MSETRYRRKLRRIYHHDDDEKFFAVSVPKRVATAMGCDRIEWVVSGDDIRMVPVRETA